MRLLITTVDQTTNGPLGCKAWDIISVLPDGHPCGREVSIDEWVADGNDAADFPNPHFAIIDIPGEPPDLNLADPEHQLDEVVPGDGRRVVTAKRAWRVDPNRLSPAEVTQAQLPGQTVVLNRRSKRTAVRRKEDDAQLPPRIPNDGTTVQRFPDTVRRQRGA
jgi:hypothetical protein